MKHEEGLSIEEAIGEPRLGCLSSLGSLRKGGLWDRFRGSAWDQLPAAHCPLPVALEFRRCVSVNKEVGEEGNGLGGSPEGEVCWVLCLQAFISHRQESEGMSQERDSAEYQFSRCAFSESWPLIGLSHCSWS